MSPAVRDAIADLGRTGRAEGLTLATAQAVACRLAPFDVACRLAPAAASEHLGRFDVHVRADSFGSLTMAAKRLGLADEPPEPEPEPEGRGFVGVFGGLGPGQVQAATFGPDGKAEPATPDETERTRQALLGAALGEDRT